MADSFRDACDPVAPSADLQRVGEGGALSCTAQAATPVPGQGAESILTQPAHRIYGQTDSTAPMSPEHPHTAQVSLEAPGLLFAPGDLVSERYRIQRFIAGGGMGEVYAADDLVLRETIALKALRPEVAHEPGVVEGFRREIQLARRVAHPGICRNFDIGFHETGHDDGPVAFLTMELLSGETLADRLERDGRLDVDEALPLVRQMALALAAAHEMGISHRDIKTNNVMLVPSDEGLRAVLTDFGLAGRIRPEAEEASSDGTPLPVWGTPAYMAPEQLVRRNLGPETDIYALGVVMFEMVTGSLPFRSMTVQGMRAERMLGGPPSPRELVPSLSERWDRVIRRCLEPEPSSRFASTTEMLAALMPEAEAPALPPRLSRRQMKRRRTFWMAAVGVATVMGAVVGVVAWQRYERLSITARLKGTRGPALPGDPMQRRALALVELATAGSLPPGDEWVGGALGELLAESLAVGEELRVAPSAEVTTMRSELGLLPGRPLDRMLAERIHGYLGTEWLLTGQYSVAARPGIPVVEVQGVVTEVTTGARIATVHESGRADALLDLVGRLSVVLRAQLGMHTLGPEELRALGAPWPTKPQAWQLYLEANAAARRGELTRVIEGYRKALDIEPNAVGVRVALAELLDGSNRREEICKAWREGGTLRREWRMQLQAECSWLSGNITDAISLSRGLMSRYPDQLEHGLRLASFEENASRPDDLRKTFRELRELPPQICGNFALDLREAKAADQHGETERALVLAQAAIDKTRACGRIGDAGEAWLLVGWFRYKRGEFDQALTAAKEANTLLKHRQDEARIRVLWLLVALYEERSDETGLLRALEEMLGIFRSREESAIGVSLRMARSLVLTKSDHELLVNEAHQRLAAVERSATPLQLLELAGLFTAIGEPVQGETLARRAAALAEAAALPAFVASAKVERAHALVRQSRLPEAIAAAGAALEACKQVGFVVAICEQAPLLQAELQLATGQLTKAYYSYMEALEHLGPQRAANRQQAELGVLRVLYEQGKRVKMAERARALLRQSSSPTNQNELRAALALATAGSAQPSGARPVMAPASGSEAAPLPHRLHCPSFVIEAWLQSALPDAPWIAATIKELNQRIAQPWLHPQLRMEYRLWLALLVKHQQSPTAQQLLRALASDAERLGYRLIATKARLAGQQVAAAHR